MESKPATLRPIVGDPYSLGVYLDEDTRKRGPVAVLTASPYSETNRQTVKGIVAQLSGSAVNVDRLAPDPQDIRYLAQQAEAEIAGYQERLIEASRERDRALEESERLRAEKKERNVELYELRALVAEYQAKVASFKGAKYE